MSAARSSRSPARSYFATLKSPILSGRAFTAGRRDRDASRSSIVNETLAKTQSPGRDPVGRSITLGRQSARIVGVVADIHDDGLDVPVASRIYFPLLPALEQRADGLSTARPRIPRRSDTTSNAPSTTIDPTLPVFGQSTMESLLADSMVRRRSCCR